MHRKSQRTIVIAPSIAFCSGVKRAVSLAETEAKSNSKVYTVDSIVHNEEEVERLASLGIKEVGPNDSDGVIILPAHGATSNEISSLSKRFFKVVDTTCPLVLRTVKIIRDMKSEGYRIAIVGDNNHRETAVLKDTAGATLYGVYQDESSVVYTPFVSKLAVVAQSTSTEERLFGVARKLIGVANEVRLFNTICNETLVRQNDAKELAKRVDCMIVIGGRTSANSKSLFEMVISINRNTFFVHSPDDVKDIDFSRCNSIGITSGTSTPSWLIDEIIQLIYNL
jgi:4-hydroxy-3-methylbut-2-enyl diphosphate reductase